MCVLEGVGGTSLNTGLHGSMPMMIDLRGSSANTENLLRIRSGPANRLKETVHCFLVIIPATILTFPLFLLFFLFFLFSLAAVSWSTAHWGQAAY